jgi:F0F1-type ATP synthase gamma subunit
MRTLHKKGFKLPFIGREQFTKLTTIGINYHQGFFAISNYNNIEKIMESLSEILKEKVRFIQTCHVCATEFLCNDCSYYASCPSRDLPFQCLCQTCLQEENRE